jgi:hypothetical protein
VETLGRETWVIINEHLTSCRLQIARLAVRTGNQSRQRLPLNWRKARCLCCRAACSAVSFVSAYEANGAGAVGGASWAHRRTTGADSAIIAPAPPANHRHNPPHISVQRTEPVPTTN